MTHKLRRNICIWNFVVFTCYWDVRYDINGGDITSNNHEPKTQTESWFIQYTFYLRRFLIRIIKNIMNLLTDLSVNILTDQVKCTKHSTV